jgi:hypothetical protein
VARLSRGQHHLGVGDAEDVEHVFERDLRPAVSDELLERAQRVPERPGGCPGDHPHRGLGDLNPLVLRHPPHDPSDLLERGALEVETVAAVDDRGRHLVCLGRGEHEDDVRGWLLERLQKRVPGRGRQHVGLVEDVDPAVALHGGECHVLTQLADVVY